MLDGMPRVSSRCSGGLAAAASCTAESPPAPALKATVPSSTVKVSGFRRSSVERPGMFCPRSESRSLSSEVDVAPRSCSTAATVRTSAAEVVSSVKATSRWLGLPVSENVSGCACTKAESDALSSGSAVSVDRRCSPTCARLTRPRA
eukprot:scaffold35890_cov65-Phaeocystis_antarctica.AAC.2